MSSDTVEGKDRDELLQLLEAFASERRAGPVWINPLPILTPHGRGILCEISQDPGYRGCGSVRFRPLPGRERVFRIDSQPGDFLEPDLFRQTVNELLRMLGVLRAETSPAGRPPDADYDWAYQEEKGRPRSEVYSEWLRRIGNRSVEMASPWDSYTSAMRRRKKKEKRKLPD